jgi:hypothetical protein
MRRLLFAAAVALLAVAYARMADDYNSPEWKDEIAHGYRPYRKLTYDDFPVCDGVPTQHWMHTEGFFHYSFKSSWRKRDADYVARVVEMTIRSGFDVNKSWRRSTFSETKALLEHEQGHLDINELHAADFRAAKLPEGTGETQAAALEDLREKMKALCAKFGDESNAEQEKYDKETNHGANTELQSRWTEALRKRIEDRHIDYWDKNG